MLKSRFPEIAAELDPALAIAEQAAADLVMNSAKARVPFVTGDLQRSIHTERQDDGVYVVAGDHKVFYGRFVEHGHDGGRVAPRPFLVPALEENRGRAEELVNHAIDRVT